MSTTDSSIHPESDSGFVSDDDPSLALKINKGLSMGYDYELIKSVIQQQNEGDDMSKFIETMIRTAEVNNNNQRVSPILSENEYHSENNKVPIHDVYIIDGADLAFSYGTNCFSWNRIEICLKYFHSHGHKKVHVILPYSLKHHRHEQDFSESKILRDLERQNLLIYTNRILKQMNKSISYTHINEMLKLTQKMKGYLITNVSLKDIFLDFSIYKQILEEKIIRYQFQNENHFQPLLVSIVTGQDGNDCETYYPLCPYGKKCTFGFKCKYFHIERRQQNPIQAIQRGFNSIKSSPEYLHMYTSSSNLVDDARMAYEYGLTSTPMSNEYTFVNQYPYAVNRSYSMPMQQVQYFSTMSLSSPPMVYNSSSSVNSQEGLADRIQSVRHLWEREN